MGKVEVRERELPKALLKWYEFHKDDNVLYIGNRTDAVYESLLELSENKKIMTVKFATVDVVCEMCFEMTTVLYDVVILSEWFELCDTPETLFEKASMLLTEHGRFLMYAHNRLGIRYFCGDRDPYTRRNYDGIENYRKAVARPEDSVNGKMYDKKTLTEMLQSVGYEKPKFFSVFPGLESPSLIFADSYEPNEELNIRCVPMYHNPDTVFLEEEYLYTGLIRNKMFHTMANAFLIECSKDKDEMSHQVLQVTSSIDRGKNDAFFTLIYSNKIVEKRAVYPEGKNCLKRLFSNSQDLESRGIHMVHARLENDSYIMPYVDAESAILYLRRLAYQDKIKFIHAMDRFCDDILRSSDIYKNELNGIQDRFFTRGYYDLVPLNSFVVGGEYVFYDQEFVIEDCPVGVIISRLVDLVYQGEPKMEKIVPRTELLVRYGIDKNIDIYRSLAWKYVVELRKEDELRVFYEQTRRNAEIVEANRKRMNYSETEYERIFVDALKNLGNRKLILFGSGAFAKRFLAMYGKDYPVEIIIDNNPNRWGQKIENILIQSPDILNKLDKSQYKVLICIKNYLSVSRQLEALGINDYGIFDSSRSYSKNIVKYNTIQNGEKNNKEKCKQPIKKKYRTGYVAGVFDMFHIGHVRLLEKAKEQCEYLIVGVVSDEDCYKHKEKHPIIPCSERVEVLKACKYVDRVEVLPTGFGGIRDAHKMYQFDVQFSGDDHGDDGGWLAEKEYLKKHGVDLVFFDYTKETSSTEIRKKL